MILSTRAWLEGRAGPWVFRAGPSVFGADPWVFRLTELD
jgi:hypothetical protein